MRSFDLSTISLEAFACRVTVRGRFIVRLIVNKINHKQTMSGITLDLVRSSHDGLIRKTKIFCTLGPACWSVEGLGQLIDAGMNIARFNFSHGDHAAHGACLERLRAALALRPGVHVGVMLDTKGPEIRTGILDPSCGGKLKLVKGDQIEVGTDYARLCTPAYLVRPVDYPC